MGLSYQGMTLRNTGTYPGYPIEKYWCPRRALFRLGVGPIRRAVTQQRLACLMKSRHPKDILVNFLNWSLHFSETLSDGRVIDEGETDAST